MRSEREFRGFGGFGVGEIFFDADDVAPVKVYYSTVSVVDYCTTSLLTALQNLVRNIPTKNHVTRITCTSRLPRITARGRKNAWGRG